MYLMRRSWCVYTCTANRLDTSSGFTSLVQRRELQLKANYKVFHHIVASSAESVGALNTGLDTVNLRRPTLFSRIGGRCGLNGKAPPFRARRKMLETSFTVLQTLVS